MSVRSGERRTNVSAVDRLSRRLEAEANILVPPLLLGRNLLATWIPQIRPTSPQQSVPRSPACSTRRVRTANLRVLEEVLLLESLLNL